MLSIVFMEHIRQIIFYYTQYGGGLRNLITGLIYIILIIYNIIHKLFISRCMDCGPNNENIELFTTYQKLFIVKLSILYMLKYNY